MKPTMSSHSNLGHYVVKPAAVGAAGAAASFMLHGSKASITIRGTTVPLSLALGAGMFVGSILGEFVHDKLFPLAGPPAPFQRQNGPLPFGTNGALACPHGLATC